MFKKMGADEYEGEKAVEELAEFPNSKNLARLIEVLEENAGIRLTRN
jgi:hypothetical protein